MFLRFTLLTVGLIFSYIGNICFQSGEKSDMAVGIGAALIAVLCFFFLGKGLWRVLGCLTTFIIMAALVGTIVFFICNPDFVNDITDFFAGFYKSES